MSTKNVKVTTVVLKFPKVVAIFLIYAKAIYMAMVENPLFAAFSAKVTTLITDINALAEAETGFKMVKPTHTYADRNLAFEKVKADLRTLRNYVQELVDADPANAESIIESAGMSERQQTSHGKRKNTAKDGVESGSVDLTGEGAGHHQWRFSTDGEIWTLLTSTRSGKTTVGGLTPGITYYFQNQRMLPNDEKIEWSQSVKIMVR